MKKLSTFHIGREGQVCAFDERGEQVPEINRGSLSRLLGEHIERCGYDPEGVMMETPNGIKIMERSEFFGWRWK